MRAGVDRGLEDLAAEHVERPDGVQHEVRFGGGRAQRLPVGDVERVELAFAPIPLGDRAARSPSRSATTT